MGDTLAIVFGRAGELFDPRLAAEAGGGRSSAIGAKAIRVAHLRLLASPGRKAALFGLLDRVDERLDLTQRIRIDAREAEVGIRCLRIQPGALAKSTDRFLESGSIARGNAHEVRIDIRALGRDNRPR